MRQKNIDKIQPDTYSDRGSLVECRLPIKVSVCSSPSIFIIFKLVFYSSIILYHSQNVILMKIVE
jgi:hypothetical protein